MIYIRTTDEKVTFTHYMPFDEKYGLHKTEEELLKDGYLVEVIPKYEGDIPDGKRPELHYNGSMFSFVMVDQPKSKDDIMKEKLTSLESQQDDINEAILGLMNMINGTTE